MDFSIQSAINEAVKTKREKREQTAWYPSSLGACLTGAYLARKGNEPDESYDDRTLRVFQVGKMLEEWAVGIVAKHFGEQNIERQVKCELSELNIRGYADLVVNTPEGKLPYEIKSKHSKSFWYMDLKKQGPNRQHEMQLWIYLKALNLSEGRLIYFSKDDLAILEYIVRLDNHKLEKEVLGELKILNEAWKQQLPPEPIRDPKDWKSKYCKFHKQCLSQKEYLKI